MKKSLDEIFIRNGTDKGSNGHNYSLFYEKHLPEKVISFLEVGVWKGAGIKSFKEWYNDEGYFCGLERYIQGHELATPGEMNDLGIGYFDVDHDSLNQLESIKEKFTVISEDGSHHWNSQINIFKRFFIHNLYPGGLYVVEDVFDEVYWGRGLIIDPKDNMNGIMKKYLREKSLHSLLVSEGESVLISSMIDEVYMYENIIFIKKKL
jgi:hypothetical protein